MSAFNGPAYGASKNYTDEHGGGGATGIRVGYVDQNTTAFPTKRPDESPLQKEDYVSVSSVAEVPFTVGSITFNSKRDTAVWTGGQWVLSAGAVIESNEVFLKQKTRESLSSTQTIQSATNIEFANAIGRSVKIDVDDKTNLIEALNYVWVECKKAGYTFTITNTDNDSIRSIVFNVKDKGGNILIDNTLNDFILKTRKVAGYDLVDDITPQEIQDAIKDLTATLTNKTMSADDNTFTDFETDNFKNSALAKSTDNVRSYEESVDTKIVVEKFLQKTLRNISTPTQDNYAANKKYVDDEIQKVLDSTFTFKGFISTTQPSGNLKAGMLWYNSNALPTTFSINVKTYDGTNWSSETSEYTPAQFETWSFGEHGYYWFGNNWNILDTSTSTVDNTSIDRNNQNELEVKDSGITIPKLNSNVADNSTIELDNTNGLQIKDAGITDNKLANDIKVGSLSNLNTTEKSNVVDAINEINEVTDNKVDKTNGANKIYGTDENGEQKLWDTSAFGGFTNDTDYDSSPTGSNKLSNVDLSTGKVKHITFDNLWAWIKNKLAGAISTVLTDNLTGGRAVITNTSGKLTVAAAITAQTTLAIYPQKLSATGLTSEVGTGQAISAEYKSAANNQLFSRNGANALWKNATKMVGIFSRSSSQTVSFNTWGNVSLTTTDSGSTNTSYCSLSGNGIKISKAGTYRFDIVMRLTDSVASETWVGWCIGCTGEQDTENGGCWIQTKNRHKTTTSIIHYCAANAVIYPCVYILNGINTVNYCKVIVNCLKEA